MELGVVPASSAADIGAAGCRALWTSASSSGGGRGELLRWGTPLSAASIPAPHSASSGSRSDSGSGAPQVERSYSRSGGAVSGTLFGPIQARASKLKAEGTETRVWRLGGPVGFGCARPPSTAARVRASVLVVGVNLADVEADGRTGEARPLRRRRSWLLGVEPGSDWTQRRRGAAVAVCHARLSAIHPSRRNSDAASRGMTSTKGGA